jgi:proteasome assembly chaperone (PAC2) family protein
MPKSNDFIQIQQTPQLRNGKLLTAFSGWPDAGEAATGALKYLVRSLNATKIASIDPEEFYDFSQERPFTAVNDQGKRITKWQRNEFYYWEDPHQQNDLLIFIGCEPHLKWRTFTQIITEFAIACETEFLMTIGALLNTVPHTRKPRISGRSTDPSFASVLEAHNLLINQQGNYSGPTGIHSVLTEAWQEIGLASGSLWGHAPHYLPQMPNPKVSHGIASNLAKVLNIPLNLTDLENAVLIFEKEVVSVLERNSELQQYVTQIEKQYDQLVTPSTTIAEDPPDPELLVEDLERFLRSERENGPQN